MTFGRDGLFHIGGLSEQSVRYRGSDALVKVRLEKRILTVKRVGCYAKYYKRRSFYLSFIVAFLSGRV